MLNVEYLDYLTDRFKEATGCRVLVIHNGFDLAILNKTDDK